MKLTNTTDFPDAFLRRLVSWCCKDVGLPVLWMRRSTYRNTSAAFSGHGGGRSIRVSVGPASAFPIGEYVRYGVKHVGFADRVEALVGVTAHEVYHCWQSKAGTIGRGGRFVEPAAMNAERSAVNAFRARREELLATWSAVPETVAADRAPKRSAVDQRAVKATADLKRWRAKLKLAQTKVKKLSRRVAYYQGKATAP